jgi:hypothetical protein
MAEESGHAELVAASDRTELLLEAEPSPQIPAETFIEGEVLALDYRGQELAPQDGEVSFKLAGGKDPRFPRELTIAVEVKAGRFRHDSGLPLEQLQGYRYVDVLRAVLGGAPATAPIRLRAGESPYPEYEPGAAVRLVLVCMPRHQLEVFAAESGEPLSKAFVLDARAASRFQDLPAPPVPVLSSSPLEAPFDPAQVTHPRVSMLVGAPQRISKQISVEITSPGPTRVELERAASLEILWPGEPLNGFVILCQTDMEPRQYSMERGAAALRVEGLRPGTVQVLAAKPVNSASLENPTLATVQGTLLAGETTRLVLQEDRGAALSLTEVVGRVRIAREWQLEKLSLRGAPHSSLMTGLARLGVLCNVDDLPLVPEGDWLTGSFRLPDVPAGDLFLEIRELSFSQHVHVPPQGLFGLEVIVGAPQNLRVSFADRATGELVAFESCQCNGVPIDMPWHDVAVPLDLKLSPGSLKLFVRFQRHLPLSTTLTVAPGQPELILPVDPCPKVSMSMPEGTNITIMSAPGRWLPTLPRVVAAEGAQGQVLRTEFGGSRMLFMVDRPGRYRLELPILENFRGIEPPEFELGPGADLHLPIEWIPR